MLVAEGAVDISAEPEVSMWDLAALQVIVQEAGGRFTSLSGVAARTPAASSAPTAHLDDEVLAYLAAGPRRVVGGAVSPRGLASAAGAIADGMPSSGDTRYS